MPLDDLTFALTYRPPLHWDAMLRFLAARSAEGAEVVAEGQYSATVRIAAPETAGPSAGGTLAAARDVVGDVTMGLLTHASSARRERTGAALHAISVRISPSLVPVIKPLTAKLRDLLDLNADPDEIAQHLVRTGVAASIADVGGVRIPGALDSFGLALRAILGQQVSVKGATTVMGRLVATFGEPYLGSHPALTRLIPTASALAGLETGDIAQLGMPGARANAVLALARAVAKGSLVLAPGGDPAHNIRSLTALPGIGDWTAHYIAMRALRWPDAFPANDLVLRRAAGGITAAQLTARSQAWRPWRAYAAMHLWRTAPAAPPVRRSTTPTK